ncbi:hypothetical protein [Streptomyces sp. NBC_00102]|uniref:hypothetical protein n=1 Tax=Streptomyces sp. NBC_00102 TaxID=2975652 RepID=UPI002255C9D1|nr:hypothetical protein [Streptomyces sp. NBC_00102]MCX5398496.1 hypothetical protein [Streptomyces sp. NBC_00102]
MRELIALTSIGLSSVLGLVAFRGLFPRRPGRHSAAHTTAPAAVAPASPSDPWMRPWTGPTKEEAAAMFRRQADTPTMPLGVIQERRRAAALATLGVEADYGYPNDQFQQLANAGVRA